MNQIKVNVFFFPENFLKKLAKTAGSETEEDVLLIPFCVTKAT